MASIINNAEPNSPANAPPKVAASVATNKVVPAWKLRNQQAAKNKEQQSSSSSSSQQGGPRLPGGGSVSNTAALFLQQATLERARTSNNPNSRGSSQNNSGRTSPTYAAEQSASLNDSAANMTMSVSGIGIDQNDTYEQLPARSETPVDPAAQAKRTPGSSSSGIAGGAGGAREKPSLRKAARMAMMLNRFAPPDAGPSEPKVRTHLTSEESELRNETGTD